MGFNKRKMEDQRREAAEKETASRRATDAQVLEDAERLIAAWNERQAKRMPRKNVAVSLAKVFKRHSTPMRMPYLYRGRKSKLNRSKTPSVTSSFR
jgi:hypothetical protein